MKKIVFALGLAALTMVACKKDEPAASTPAKTGGSFTYDGTSYELSQGFLAAYGADSGVFNFDIDLFSSGVIMHESNGLLDSITGMGHELYLELWTSSSTSLQPGTYNVDTTGFFANKIITYADVSMNGDFRSEPEVYDQIISGTATITSATANSVSFTFSGMTALGKTITASFSGNLALYDYSGSEVAPNSGPNAMTPKEF